MGMTRETTRFAPLLFTVMLFSAGTVLSGCSTTPDESYKEAEMEKPLDYPPDLVAPTLNRQFEVPQASTSEAGSEAASASASSE